MNNIKRIIITPGEPAGIGPDIVIAISQQSWPIELMVIADPTLLQARAKQLNLPLEIIPVDFNHPATIHIPGTLKVFPITLGTSCVPGKLDINNAAYVIKTLEIAALNCLNHTADALVTGPVQKSILNEANIPFTGHTEFLAALAHVNHTVMLFVVEQLKIALTTTHLPLSEVPKAITKELLHATLKVLLTDMQKYFKLSSPKILVCGLNPHAGENGYLGREEITTIAPVLDTLRAKNINVVGPLPADTIFTPHHLQDADVVLGMYHDQVLPLVKYLGFNHAVNVTLGLPFIRTSVDHGTALSLAGTGKADSGSMASAIKLAISMIN